METNINNIKNENFINQNNKAQKTRLAISIIFFVFSTLTFLLTTLLFCYTCWGITSANAGVTFVGVIYLYICVPSSAVISLISIIVCKILLKKTKLAKTFTISSAIYILLVIIYLIILYTLGK